MNINNLLTAAARKGASDLHLTVGIPPTIRVDGMLSQLDGEEPVSAKNVEALAFSMISTQQKETFLKDRDLDIAYEIDKVGRFRVNLHFEKGFIGLVARTIPNQIPTMEDIGMPDILYDLARLEQGFVLVTGPTGHGKSTSLAAMVNLINQERNCSIVTLEDPIEYLFQSNKSIIKQRELGKDMISFAEGLKHVLRQDPNVIMVGEMRDLETIAAAITVAETGHLVLATLHTFDASQTIDRIIDVFPPYQQDQVRLQVSMTLKGIVSQRLIPKVGGGRVAAREVLINTPAVASMIRDNKVTQIKTAIQTGRAEGMRPIDVDLKELVKQGVVEESVAVKYTLN